MVLYPFEVPISSSRVRRLLRTSMLSRRAVAGSRFSIFLLWSGSWASWCRPASARSVSNWRRLASIYAVLLPASSLMSSTSSQLLCLRTQTNMGQQFADEVVAAQCHDIGSLHRGVKSIKHFFDYFYSHEGCSFTRPAQTSPHLFWYHDPWDFVMKFLRLLSGMQWLQPHQNRNGHWLIAPRVSVKVVQEACCIIHRLRHDKLSTGLNLAAQTLKVEVD